MGGVALARVTFLIAFLLIAYALPAETQEENLAYTIPTDYGLQYGVGKAGGIFVANIDDAVWLELRSGLPSAVVYPFDDGRPRRVTSLSIDPINTGRLAITTAYNVYHTTSDEWFEIPISVPIKAVDYLSAIALSPHDPDVLYAGTSFSGVFKTETRGATWESLASSIGRMYRGAGFYDEVSALAVSPTDSDTVYLAIGFDGDILQSLDGGDSWDGMDFTGAQTAGEIHAITFSQTGSSEQPWLVVVHGSEELWTFTGLEWIKEAPDQSTRHALEAPERERALRIKTAQGRTGIYVNSLHAYGDRLKNHLDLLRDHGMDSIVVDVKDDFGRVRYDTDLDLPRSFGAVGTRFILADLLKQAHDAGVYVIGRIVVFQDPKLYAYNDNEHAIWNERDDGPWANLIPVRDDSGEITGYEQREFWVDPYSELAWEYNTALAFELQERGVDEIQFDYIRFPSDGDTTTTYYRHRKPDMTMVDAIESFLKYARERITIPISTDLYGFNAWYRMGNWIGQNIEVIGDYVDVVCPMFYPSHFPRAFMNELQFMERAEWIYLEGVRRAQWILAGRGVVRPYVQAFLIGSERKFDEPEYADYLHRQLDGLTASGSSGFTLWNASNIYYMITQPLTPYTASEGEQ